MHSIKRFAVIYFVENYKTVMKQKTKNFGLSTFFFFKYNWNNLCFIQFSVFKIKNYPFFFIAQIAQHLIIALNSPKSKGIVLFFTYIYIYVLWKIACSVWISGHYIETIFFQYFHRESIEKIEKRYEWSTQVRTIRYRNVVVTTHNEIIRSSFPV